MKRQPISVFTPSNDDPEVLERIFVQRHRLLEKIVDRLKRSMLTGEKHHALLIGPRGSGKTNMVTLAQHRLTQQTELQDAMRIAWLGEDDTITGLIDLALGIADRLADAFPSEFDADYRALFRGLPPDDAAEAILLELHQRLKHRYLLLIVENLDSAFKGLGDQGQKRWRAFLQEKGRVATLATAQQIFEAVSDRDFPFWGFFDIHHLAALSFEDARTLIRNISIENKNRELVQFLDTADGRYRIRSLHHLAGGNHRMYVLLSEFLTKDSLDDLVGAFETLADELTPYFQERLRSLPAQQAKIVQCLATASGATTVKEIAALTFIDERSCSKQLGELRNKRYVQSEKRGKESYYELSEPLMRLCLEVKNQRGKPLQLIAKFLKVWFRADVLQSQLKSNMGNRSRADEYRAYALELDNQLQPPVLEKMNIEYQKHFENRNFEAAQQVAEELQCADPIQGLWKAARVKHERGDFAGELEAFTSLIEMSTAPAKDKAMARFNRGLTYRQLGEARKEIEDYTSIIEMPALHSDLKVRALINRGLANGKLGETENECADYASVIAMRDAIAEHRARALVLRGATLHQVGQIEKAITDFTLVIEMPGAPIETKTSALSNRAVAYGKQGQLESLLADCSKLIDMPDSTCDQKAMALLNRGVAHGKLGETEKEYADYTLVIEMPDATAEQLAEALFNRGVAFSERGELENSLADLSKLIDMPDSTCDQKAMALLNRGVTYDDLGETERECADYTSVIEMPDASSERKAKALVNRGATFGQLGDIEKAIADFTAVIEMSIAPTELEAIALVNRAFAYSQRGELENSLADCAKLIEMPDAPADRKADAFLNQGMGQWRFQAMKQSLESYRSAIRMASHGSETRCDAMFALPDPLVEVGSLEDVSVELRRAFEENERTLGGYGGTPSRLFWMVLNRGSKDWDKYVGKLVPLYVEFGAADKLAGGLTQLISSLDKGDFSKGQLDQWNEVWQKHGAAVEELEIALQCLSASAEAIKTKSDRPLFQLPQEVRSLVRSLLAKSLGPV